MREANNIHLGGREDLRENKLNNVQDILLSMIDDKNVELKTEILRPKDFSSFEMFGEELGSEKVMYNETSTCILDYVEIYRINMVSNLRKSRKEIIDAISSIFDKETIRMTLGERLTSNLK